MPRYIDAEKIEETLIWLLQDFCNHPKKEAGLKSALSLIQSAPAADVVEVVRCKDCKHRIICETVRNDRYWSCGNPISGMAGGVEIKDDDFCSYGERKEDT